MFKSIDTSTVFITGAASGIGRAQVEAFLENGANVFGFDLQEKDLSTLTQKFPDTFAFQTGSVANSAEVKKSIETAIELFGQITTLLNTAGILDDYKPSLETNEDLWQRILDTNLTGMFRVTNAVLPYMLKQQHGVIINMASIAGLVAGGGGAAYTSSKHAIIGYTKQLDFDYCRQGIRANAIAPGAIKTPMNAADFVGDAEMANWVAEETPAGRWAKPEEVADLTLFLASKAADYIHGAVMPIDGGWTMK